MRYGTDISVSAIPRSLTMRAISLRSLVWRSAIASSSISALNASSFFSSTATRASSSAIRAFFRRFFSRQRFRIFFSNATEFLSTSRYSASIRALSSPTRRSISSTPPTSVTTPALLKTRDQEQAVEPSRAGARFQSASGTATDRGWTPADPLVPPPCGPRILAPLAVPLRGHLARGPCIGTST